MKLYLFIVVLVSTLSCSDARNAATSTDKEKIQGVWLGQTESVNGSKKDVSFLYVFNGDTLSFTDETGKVVKYSFRLDTTGNLKFIIIQPDETLNIRIPTVNYLLPAS